MKLYTMEDIIETLISVPDIKGAPYIELEEKLLELKPAMIIPECGGCMGPSYNPRDCEKCKNGWSRAEGEWKNTIGGIYACSNCKSSFTAIPKTGQWKPMWNYCPNCGAKMRSE